MSSATTVCTCPEDGYSPHCAYAFFQGGQMLHEVKGDGRLKKRYEVVQLAQAGDNIVHEVVKREERIAPVTNAELQDELSDRIKFPTANRHDSFVDPPSERLYEDLENRFVSVPKRMTTHDERANQSNLVDADDMLANNRDILRKYEPLRIGNNSLTEMSIGGFPVDLSKAAQKAAEVVPLPAAKLPKIFIDSEMNFSHHFFQGLERLIGRKQVLEIVGKKKYYTDEAPVLLPLIEGIIKVGYERKDTNLTVFTKSVLASTFDIDERTTSESAHRGLLVGANLWGFQYIEPGMECKEADLKMWLRVCYNKFENIFFNTFKDSGMPDFALEGVQARYEPVASHPIVPLKELNEMNLQHEAAIQTKRETEPSYEVARQYSYDDMDDGASIRHPNGRRKRRTRRAEPSIGNLLFGIGR